MQSLPLKPAAGYLLLHGRAKHHQALMHAGLLPPYRQRHGALHLRGVQVWGAQVWTLQVWEYKCGF